VTTMPIKYTKYIKATWVGIAYIVLSLFTHYIIFPEESPKADNFPRQGITITNAIAGETITFVKDRYTGDPNLVEIQVSLNPQSSVPMMHVHSLMTEVFTSLQGNTCMLEKSNVHQLKVGQSIEIKPGTPHLPLNTSDALSIIKVSMLPVGVFDLCLVNIHEFLSQPPTQQTWLTTQFQLARYAWFCDVYRSDIPVWLQKAGLFIGIPTLRILGFKAWEE